MGAAIADETKMELYEFWDFSKQSSLVQNFRCSKIGAATAGLESL